MNNFELNRYDQSVSEIPQNILNCYLTKYFSKEDQELIRSVHFDNLSTEELLKKYNTTYNNVRIKLNNLSEWIVYFYKFAKEPYQEEQLPKLTYSNETLTKYSFYPEDYITKSYNSLAKVYLNIVFIREKLLINNIYTIEELSKYLKCPLYTTKVLYRELLDLEEKLFPNLTLINKIKNEINTTYKLNITSKDLSMFLNIHNYKTLIDLNHLTSEELINLKRISSLDPLILIKSLKTEDSLEEINHNNPTWYLSLPFKEDRLYFLINRNKNIMSLDDIKVIVKSLSKEEQNYLEDYLNNKKKSIDTSELIEAIASKIIYFYYEKDTNAFIRLYLNKKEFTKRIKELPPYMLRDIEVCGKYALFGGLPTKESTALGKSIKDIETSFSKLLNTDFRFKNINYKTNYEIMVKELFSDCEKEKITKIISLLPIRSKEILYGIYNSKKTLTKKIIMNKYNLTDEDIKNNLDIIKNTIEEYYARLNQNDKLLRLRLENNLFYPVLEKMPKKSLKILLYKEGYTTGFIEDNNSTIKGLNCSLEDIKDSYNDFQDVIDGKINAKKGIYKFESYLTNENPNINFINYILAGFTNEPEIELTEDNILMFLDCLPKKEKDWYENIFGLNNKKQLIVDYDQDFSKKAKYLRRNLIKVIEKYEKNDILITLKTRKDDFKKIVSLLTEEDQKLIELAETEESIIISRNQELAKKVKNAYNNLIVKAKEELGISNAENKKSTSKTLISLENENMPRVEKNYDELYERFLYISSEKEITIEVFCILLSFIDQNYLDIVYERLVNNLEMSEIKSKYGITQKEFTVIKEEVSRKIGKLQKNYSENNPLISYALNPEKYIDVIQNFSEENQMIIKDFAKTPIIFTKNIKRLSEKFNKDTDYIKKLGFSFKRQLLKYEIKSNRYKNELYLEMMKHPELSEEEKMFKLLANRLKLDDEYIPFIEKAYKLLPEHDQESIKELKETIKVQKEIKFLVRGLKNEHPFVLMLLDEERYKTKYEKLTPDKQKVIKYIYDIDTKEYHSLTETRKEFNLTSSALSFIMHYFGMEKQKPGPASDISGKTYMFEKLRDTNKNISEEIIKSALELLNEDYYKAIENDDTKKNLRRDITRFLGVKVKEINQKNAYALLLLNKEKYLERLKEFSDIEKEILMKIYNPITKTFHNVNDVAKEFNLSSTTVVHLKDEFAGLIKPSRKRTIEKPTNNTFFYILEKRYAGVDKEIIAKAYSLLSDEDIELLNKPVDEDSKEQKKAQRFLNKAIQDIVNQDPYTLLLLDSKKFLERLSELTEEEQNILKYLYNPKDRTYHSQSETCKAFDKNQTYIYKLKGQITNKELGFTPKEVLAKKYKKFKESSFENGYSLLNDEEKEILEKENPSNDEKKRRRIIANNLTTYVKKLEEKDPYIELLLDKELALVKLNKLDENEQEILNYLYDVQTKISHSLGETMQKFSVTKKNIDNIKDKFVSGEIKEEKNYFTATEIRKMESLTQNLSPKERLAFSLAMGITGGDYSLSEITKILSFETEEETKAAIQTSIDVIKNATNNEMTKIDAKIKRIDNKNY